MIVPPYWPHRLRRNRDPRIDEQIQNAVFADQLALLRQNGCRAGVRAYRLQPAVPVFGLEHSVDLGDEIFQVERL